MAELSDAEVFGAPQKELSDAEVFAPGFKGTAAPGQLGALAGKAQTAVRSALAQKDRDVDYSGVNDPAAQAAYSLISTPQDRTAYLQQKYGPGNVTQDSYGRDVVLVNGKRVAFASREPGTSATLGQDVAAHAGDVLPTAGIIAGAVAGAPSGPAGSIGLAAGGGAAGVAGNKLVAGALGLPSSQSTPEVAGDILKGAAEGAGAETLGQGAMLAGRSLLAPYKPGSILGPWSRTRPLYDSQMADVQASRDMGLRPRVGTFAPNAPLVQRVQQAGMRVFGDELPNLNRPILEGKIGKLTAQAGEGAGVPSGNLNAALSKRADVALERANYGADIATKDAEAELRAAQAKVESGVGAPTGKLAGSVSDDILASRTRFGDKASALYAPVDAMVGKPVVPTQPLKDALQGIIDTMPKTQSGALSVLTPEKLQKFAQGIQQLPDNVSFQQMQAIRSKFRDASDVGALDAGLSERQSRLLANAADSSFDAAASGPFAGSADATAALRKADNFYRAGIKRFDDLSVQALVKDASDTGFVQPEKVAKFIATPGQADKLWRIKKVVSPESFQQVGAERWKQMVGDSEDILTGQIDGKKLSKQLSDMGNSLDVLYGSQQATQMRNLAQQWAQLGGKAEVAPTSPAFLRNAIDAQAKANALAKSDWATAIKTDGPQSLQAADYLTQPQNRMAFRKARETFGDQSPEIAATKEYLARKIFSVMEQPATKGAEKYGKTELMGQPLISELNRYGRPYLEDVFGKQWTDSAYGFAKAAETATRKNPSDGGALIAAAYAMRPFSHLGGLVKMFGAQEILSSPAAITYMTRGIEGGAVDFMRAMGTLATRTGLAYEAVNAPKQARDYAAGAKAKFQGTMQP
jgi:hypothetical protein